MSDCLFCKIIQGEIPSDQVFSNDDAVAFRDVNPQAPTHILVVPRRHIASLDILDDTALGARLLEIARQVADTEGVATDGYRVVINSGPNGGQSVDHLHLHVLGGRAMTWPPG